MSQQARPRIERAFAWLKTIADLRKVKLRGLTTVDALFVFASAAFNVKKDRDVARGGRMSREAWHARHDLLPSSATTAR
jgi:hypothetical protein